ncbi:MAG: molybdopterin-synthase adenylyltransferase MoeB [Rhodothermales bacterium]|nr:molybdopterin-synthase adenylyltransferase MoeB [Rhodothermales bacterium]
MLDPDQRRRYSRHILLPEFGSQGQEKLLAASVLIVGAGGLGSPAALYLAAAGVGRIGLIDFDEVDESNLQRQVLYGTSDVGRPKIEAARDRLIDLNPGITVEVFNDRLTSDNALGYFASFDVVADGTDNFATRYLVNDASVLSGTPNVYASIFRFDGQVSVFGAPGGPCYRCLFPEPPPPGAVPSCAEGGVLGVLPGILGSLQATEVIKLITGIGESLVGRMLVVDAADMRFKTLAVTRDPDCPVCGESPEILELIDYEAFCAGGAPGPVPASGNAASDATIPPPNQTRHASSNDAMFSFRSTPGISVHEYADMRRKNSDHLLLDVRMPAEVEIADIGGTVIPMSELQDRLDEIESFRDRDVVVMCRSGGRSARVVQVLRSLGFEKAVNLEGGILAWSDQIDDSIPTY